MSLDSFRDRLSVDNAAMLLIDHKEGFCPGIKSIDTVDPTLAGMVSASGRFECRNRNLLPISGLHHGPSPRVDDPG